MSASNTKEILQLVLKGELSVSDAESKLIALRFLRLQHSTLDIEREALTGIEEVVFAKNKDLNALLEITTSFITANGSVLITKLSPESFSHLKKAFPELYYDELAEVAWVQKKTTGIVGDIAIISAGTSDRKIAQEAKRVADYFGINSECIEDVGVASLERVFEVKNKFSSKHAIIVIAGMEGALASVVAGLCDVPIVAVPSSAGYGASFEGLAALLGMLTSCSPGIVTVNIDNGFGAVCAVRRLLRVAKK